MCLQFQVCSDLLKTVVVMRNPKDMLVSLFHFYKINTLLGLFDRSWEDFFELFKNKKLLYGDWLDHVSGYWKNCSQRNNVLFIHYEDANNDIKSVLKRMATFLGKDLDDDKLHIIATHVQFANMKNNPMTNLQDLTELGILKDDSFMRQGEIGGWKDYFKEDQNKFVEEFYMEAVKEMGLSFKDN